jgi:hypothetical protein
MPVLVSDEKVKLGEVAEPFPEKTAMVAKCIKVFGYHVQGNNPRNWSKRKI